MNSLPMKDLNDPPGRMKQVTIQLPERQALVLQDYCAQHGLSPDTVVLAALCAMIEGFDQA
jgi:hypothetical protein